MKTITVQATIHAPAKRVWEYWTESEYIKNWCFASDDWCVGNVVNDVRVGGKFSTWMAAKDASAGFDMNGVYSVVEPRKRLAYTMGDGRTVTIDFAEAGGATTVTETFEMESENSEEKQRSGWQAILDNFKKYVKNRDAAVI